MNNDELDPLLEEDADELLLGKKKGGIHSDDDELFEGELDLEEEDPFMTDFGYGFGGEEDDAY